MGMMRVMAPALAALILAACGGGGGGGGTAPPAIIVTPPPPPPPPPTPLAELETKAEAAAFLQTAGLATKAADVDALTGKNASSWITEQLAKPEFGYEALMRARVSIDDVSRRQSSQSMWEAMITSDAELRARMTFALSQITVISNNQFSSRVRYGLGTWLDVLDRNAFGNYRDLMQEVTYSPIMGEYLTYAYNRKGDPDTGRQPDENYAREILQLFTIGLVELNMDGTAKLDSNGNEIETYNNEDVVGLARVFTGLAHAGTDFRSGRRGVDAYHVPMEMYQDFHSTLEKSFLGTTIPANTPGTASVDQALDAIFAHPNLAPFISRQLIQRFTASSPSPAYVGRVANAFETGAYTAEDGTAFGTGQRGDLSATLAAILLDDTVHDGVQDATEGKLREPVLKYVQLARTFAKPDSLRLTIPEYNVFADTSDPTRLLGQSPLKSPSVFNFYRPGYVAPGSETGDAGLTAPELQIVNQASALGYLNFMTRFLIQGDTDRVGIPVPDLSEELAIAADAAALVDLLDLKLTAGRMNATTRTAIVEAVEALPVRDTNSRDTDIRSRVRIAILMTVGSADFVALN
ncbi:hypothetical protein GCM10007853_24900 [Algimonas ampicilliniresistens]|uniref:DUF1800 domain-containing protein n=1 Tax=Algimonas ampicilliniresistens TaxID=1298735 RepID=A0ABQ5VAR3_9PROT|nr:DUF1800 family protein [Algimonas ampicilliniresistens]GLQ24616.1 hypothetical protein GCM10007853_24900 [Algimonas ampicilliniresistens]